MVSRSILLVSTLLFVLLAGCGSSPLPKAASSSDKPTIFKVKEDLKTRLAADERLQGSHITFDFDGDAVILNGTVKTREQFGWASTIAAGTTGVTSVINRLQIEPAAVETEAPKSPTPKKAAPKPAEPEPQTSAPQTTSN